MNTLTIELGALSPSLWEQFQRQGLEAIDANALGHWQRDADAISRCCIHGLISDSAAHTARKRLMKHISAVKARLIEPAEKKCEAPAASLPEDRPAK